MRWRYQPVWADYGDERAFGICEVYLDADGKLEMWTESMEIAPGGDDAEGLVKDCARMLVDAQKWLPVEHAAMEMGMTFTQTDADVRQLEIQFGVR